MNVAIKSLDWSIHTIDDPPVSRVGPLLSGCLLIYMLLSRGDNGEDIVATANGNGEEGGEERLAQAIRLLHQPLMNGTLKTWSRPIGGGELIEMPTTCWELDDPTERFATSRFDALQPFVPNIEPTHWIFAEQRMEESIYDLFREKAGIPTAHKTSEGAQTASPPPAPPGGNTPGEFVASIQGVSDTDNFLRLDDVIAKVGLKKSEIYRRMEKGRFPKSETIGFGRAVGWRAGKILEWLRNPQ